MGLGVVGVVGDVFYFKRIEVFASARHDVWEGVEAGVADGNSDGEVTVLL